MHRRLHGNQHPETAWGLWSLARALSPQQKLEEAESALRESLTIFRDYYPDEHHWLRLSVDDLKIVLEARGDEAGIEKLEREFPKLETVPPTSQIKQ
jgi:hypothetical protein